MSTAKEKLKDHLKKRINFLVDDSRTYLWVRFVHKKTFDKQLGIGGGNFLIVIGDFACLNLLSKVYWLLSNNPYDYLLVNEKTVEEFKKQLENLKRNANGDDYRTFFQYCSQGIRLGFQINEKEAFAKLVTDLYKDGINLGLKNDKKVIRKVWDNLRISFSHYAAPQGCQVAAFCKVTEKKINSKAFNAIINSFEKTKTHPFHIKENGEIIVFSDLLNQYLVRINSWISNKIDIATEDQTDACLKEIKV